MTRHLPVTVLLAVGLIAGPAWAGFTTPARGFELEERTVHYHVRGETGKPVAIVLGGGPGFSSWNLEPIQRRLAELGYRAAIMDMLGVGENEASLEASPLDDWIAQVEGLRRELAGDRPVVLVGHSWGALMALVYMRDYPQNADRLVLLNPVDPGRTAMRTVTEQIDARRARERGERWDDEAAWTRGDPGSRSADEHARHQIERSLPSYFLDYEQGRRYAARFDESDFDPLLNVEGWRAYRDNPVEYATIRDWDVPIDFIGCRQDLLMPESLDALQGNLSLGHVELLAGCVHFPWEEVPREFGEALERVLDAGGKTGEGESP